MFQAPTLQQLAHFAHDRFGEGGPQFKAEGATSLGVLLRIYMQEPGNIDGDLVALHASILLREWLQRRDTERVVLPSDVDVYAQMGLEYVRFQYPERGTDPHEEGLLSVLFQGHLHEAALGRATAAEMPSPQPERPETTYVLTCTCGFTMRGADEEEVYRLVRGHIDGLHPEWHQPLNIQVAETVSPPHDTMHRTIIDRLEREVINAGNLASLHKFASPEQADKLQERIALLRSGFPDLRSEVEDIVASGEEVAVRSTLEGTHQGEIFGIAPTGRRVRVESFDFFRIVDERIVDHRGGIAELDLLQQLGLIREQVGV